MRRTSGTRSSLRCLRLQRPWRFDRLSEASGKPSPKPPEVRLAEAAELLVSRFDELILAVRLLVGSHR